MMILKPDVWSQLIIWIGLGIFTGFGFSAFLKSSTEKISDKTNVNKITVFYAMSAFRIVIAALLIFFSFSQGFLSGFACLLSFIISRWILIFILARRHQAKA